MKFEQQLLAPTAAGGPFVPLVHAGADHAHDEALQELRDLWPNAVDLAKQPGLLYRLQAMLNT